MATWVKMLVLLALADAGLASVYAQERRSYRPQSELASRRLAFLETRKARLARRQRRLERRWVTNPDMHLYSSSSAKKSYGFDLAVLGGLNAGFGQASASSSGAPQDGATRNALAFAVIAQKKMTSWLTLCPEIGYVQRGVSTSLLSEGIDATGSIQLNYLEFGLGMKTYLPPITSKLKFFFVGGPTVAVALSRQVEVWGVMTMDLSDRFRKVDANILLGAGAEYAFKPDFDLVFQLRTHWGLTDMDATESRLYNRDIQLLFGVQFGL